MNHHRLLFVIYGEIETIFQKIEENWKIYLTIAGVKDFQRLYRKGGKNIKEWLVKTKINIMDSSNTISYGCYDCGKELYWL